ncbi:MAG: RNA 2',3'-cyclic phosphodiesterase [Thiotrichales bacterium]
MTGVFLALSPDDEARTAIDRLNRSADLPDGRLMPAENLHMTLRYLGTVPPAAIICVEAELAGTAMPAFTLALDYVDWYRRARVVWIGCRNPPQALLDLVNHCDAIAARCGMPPRDRPFQPHCTLRRKVRLPPPDRAVPPILWKASTLCLFRSEPLEQGVRYRELCRSKLSDD